MPVRYSEHSAGPSTRRAVLTEQMIEDLSYFTMTKAELQAELERRDLPKTGNKDELIERILADDE